MTAEFVFEMTMEATAKNFLIQKKYNFDLGKAIEAQRLSPLGYSSKFKPPDTLKKIFRYRPLWPRMEQLLIKGSKWLLEGISEGKRVANLEEALKFKNHKRASQKLELLAKLISNDICYDYGFIIPREKIACLPNACLAPMNIMMQYTLDAGVNIVDKECFTQDQSFKWQSGKSVNS
jgi:hypothetical protein